MPRSFALGAWLQRVVIPLILTTLIVLFLFYDRLILDANLRNLKTSLSVLDSATGVDQAEAALLLVDQTLVAEMAQAAIDLKTLAALEYVHGTLATGEQKRPVEDAQIMVAALAEDRAATRSGFLTTLDEIVTGVQAAFRQATSPPYRPEVGTTSPEIHLGRLKETIQEERLGHFDKAAEGYEKLLKDYPNYSDRSALRLRLGYVYQRTQALDQAERLYRQVLKQSSDSKERDVARQMLAGLDRGRGDQRQVELLKQRLSTLATGPERQQLTFELGSLLIRLYAMEKAAKTFQQAILTNPEGEWALPSLFKEAWCLRYLGRFDEALDRYQEILHRQPKGLWAEAAQHQMAEAYKAMGNYDAAAQIYEKVVTEAQDPALVAIVQAQTGAMYQYDLKDPEKARLLFEDLSRHFISSPFGGIGKQLEQLHATKAIRASSLWSQTPVLSWMQTFLPTFVDVFSARLNRYMQAAELKQLTRRYTEEEFRELVVRRIQERFPGQVTDIVTEIHPGEYAGSGKVRMGRLTFQISGRVGIRLVDERPHAVIRELKIGPLSVPEGIRKLLENQVNDAVDRQPDLLKVKQYELKDGWVLIAVERTG